MEGDLLKFKYHKEPLLRFKYLCYVDKLNQKPLKIYELSEQNNIVH